MSLYAMGEVAAKAAIRAHLESVITTGTDGVKSVNWLALKNFTGTSADAIIAALPLADRAAAQAVALSLETAPDGPAQAMDAVHSAAYWKNNNSAWPTTGTVSTSANFMEAARKAVSDAKVAGVRLDDHYKDPQKKVAAIVNAFATEVDLPGRLPETKTRTVSRVYYIYTYVTDWDEESAPSPPTDGLDVDQDDEVDISIGPPPPGRHINRWRFYATATGSTDTSFLFLAEGPITTTTGTTNPKAILGEVCPSLNWHEPSPKMRGMTAMPNGFMAGYHDNVLCFSELNVPYAWPQDYQLTAAYPIVALGAFEQTLVVAHYAGIDYVSGADPNSMSVRKDISKQACASSRSMASSDMGVIYASHDGVCLANNSGVQLISQKHFSREDWQALNPSTMVGAYHESTYYFFGDFGHAYSLHLATGKLTRLDTPGAISAVYQDPLTDGLYFCTGTSIFQLFSGPARLDGTWRSKKFVLPGQQPLAWLSVEGDFDAPITVRWFGDGELRHEVVLTERGPVRLPAGRYLEHEVEIVSKGALSAVTLASTTQELQQA